MVTARPLQATGSSASGGIIGARVGGAQATKSALRVTVWGAVAKAITALIGKAVGTII